MPPRAMSMQVQGSGFLYKQVRHMVGALLALGEGALELQDIRARLEVGAREVPGRGGQWRGYNVAPAKGLVLHEVGGGRCCAVLCCAWRVSMASQCMRWRALVWGVQMPALDGCMW